MPSPYRPPRGADVYYQYGGRPKTYVYDWQGGPQPSAWPWGAAETRALGDVPMYRVSLGPGSVLHSGPESGLIDDGVRPSMGGFAESLSENERRLLMLAGAGAAVWWFFLRKKR